MNMNFSTIALSKNLFFIGSEKHEVYSETYSSLDIDDIVKILTPQIISIQAQLMNYGYMLSEECVREMTKLSKDDLNEYALDIFEFLKTSVGDGQFTSLFENFPADVMNMSDMEFYTYQFIHYLSHETFTLNNNISSTDYPKYNAVVNDSYKIINLATYDDMKDLCKSICSASQSLTSYDKQIVEYYCVHWQELCNNIYDVFPVNIPFKETMCIVAANVDNYKCKNITDVLRVAVYLSGGDISLARPYKLYDSWETTGRISATKYKFKKFSRKERRHILSMIEYALSTYSSENDAYGEMKAYLNRWIRLGEIIHPGEYKKLYPNAFNAFYMIRDNAKYIKTFDSIINDLKCSGNITELLDTYSTRPGKFARDIDSLLRNNYLAYADQIIDSFKGVVDKVSIKVIYELIEYYYNRNDKSFYENRRITLKGRRSSIDIKSLPPLDENSRQRMLDVLTDSLKNRFKNKESLTGYFYLDKRLENISLPKNMRSMNISLGQQARGTRIPINDTTDILRLYVRWMDPNGEFDLDLSTMLYDSNFKCKAHMAWISNHQLINDNNEIYGVFSGDVRHNIGNSAEYMDIHIKRAKELGIRYVVGVVNDFDGHGFEKTDSWCGVMCRTDFVAPGETTWSPDTIDLGFSLASKCTTCVMCAIDLEEMCLIVIDEDINYENPYLSTKSIKLVSNILCKYAKRPFLNALELIKMNIGSRNDSFITVCEEDVIKAQQEFLKKWNISTKFKIENQIREYTDYLRTDLSDEDRVKYNTALNKLKTIFICMSNIKVISYEDIASDYTNLFKWMF